MKYVIKVLFLFISLFLICSCNKDKELIATITNKSEFIIENHNNISFEVDKETLTNKEATFNITNNSDNILYYNDCFFIEKENNQIWYELKEVNNVGCFPEGEKINPHEVQSIKISNLELKYGKLTKGKYRLIKEVNFESENHIFISAEFDIK